MQPVVVHEVMTYVWEEAVCKVFCCHSIVNCVLKFDKMKWSLNGDFPSPRLSDQIRTIVRCVPPPPHYLSMELVSWLVSYV
jgi:hypothetical protein